MTEPTDTPPVAGETTDAPYVSRCIVCGKPGDQHPDGRWCGSEKRVTGDWTDIPIVNDVARAIGSAFHRGNDAWTTEALAAIAAARPHLTAERDAEVARYRVELDEVRLQFLRLASSRKTPAVTDEITGLRAAREVVLGLHAHRLLDEYSRETTDPSAAKYGRCDTCGNVRDGVFCPTYLALADLAPSTPAAQENPDA